MMSAPVKRKHDPRETQWRGRPIPAPRTASLLIAKTVHPEHAEETREACSTSIQKLLREARSSAQRVRTLRHSDKYHSVMPFT